MAIVASVGLIAFVLVLVVVVSIGAGRSQPSRFSRVGPALPDDELGDTRTPPQAGRDHWHVAYGVYVCDTFLPPFSDDGPDQLGIHTHTDGIIHVHPFTPAAVGRNARLSVFADQVGMTVTDDRIDLPDRTSKRNGDSCNGQPGKWMIKEWTVDDPDSPPRTINSNLANMPFDGDRRAFTLAFVPEGADIPQPESIPFLDELTDVPPTVSRPGTTRNRSTGTTR